ncbi:MAG: response regulator [Trueperaceae bacterium]
MPEPVGCRTILVADDSVGHLRVVEMLLSAHNYDVVAVADGHEALTYLHANTPHIAILDVNMPFMTGIDLCGRVKRIARLRALPVIIMTSLVDDATIAGAEAAGADLLIHKPLAGQSVPQMIKEASAAAVLRLANAEGGSRLPARRAGGAEQSSLSADHASGDSTSSSSLL